jgi:hypothetical protein
MEHLILDELPKWRANFTKYFGIQSLTDERPRTGSFTKSKPPSFLYENAQPLNTSSRDAIRLANRERARDHRPPQSSASRRDSSGDQHRRHREPVIGTTIARSCLIRKLSPHDTRTVATLLQSVPIEQRSPIPRIHRPGHHWHSKNACFAYITEAGRGCSSRGICRFVHLDLEDPETLALGPAYFSPLLACMQQDQLRNFFAPTDALKNLCRTPDYRA